MKTIGSACLILVCVGCTPPSLQPVIIDATQAKAALLQLMESDTSPFVDLDPKELEQLPLVTGEGGSVTWGPFTIDPNQRRYHAEVAIGHCMWFYSGAFRWDRTGHWVADHQVVMHAQEEVKPTQNDF